MNVPRARIVKTSPSPARISSARLTVPRDTPCVCCRWLSLGNMSVISPDLICSRKIAASCSYSGAGSR